MKTCRYIDLAFAKLISIIKFLPKVAFVMRVGVRVLDEAGFRKILDDGFDRLGYALANSDVEKQLYRAHNSHLTPYGQGHGYLLKFSKLPDYRWGIATLIDAQTN